MKLLIITQAVDRSHPILGFFHRWLEEFAKHFEHIHVIALQVGEPGTSDLPGNVTVHSLGKERGAGKLQRLLNLISFLSSLHKNYDSVFVHMNPEYIVLAGWWWHLMGKRIGLWYNHSIGSFWLKLAQPFTNVVFHTSPYAYTVRYKNAKRMPAGIDTGVFKPHPEIKKIPKSVYFQGRIAPAKRVHVILEAFADLYEKSDANLLTLVGPEDEAYTKPLRNRYETLIKNGAVVFKGSVPNTDTPELYSAHKVSINLTDDGNYDKTVLESLACGTPAIVSSRAFKDVIPESYVLRTHTTADLKTHILKVFSGTAISPTELRQSILGKEDLVVLGEKIYTEFAV